MQNTMKLESGDFEDFGDFEEDDVSPKQLYRMQSDEIIAKPKEDEVDVDQKVPCLSDIKEFPATKVKFIKYLSYFYIIK